VQRPVPLKHRAIFPQEPSGEDQGLKWLRTLLAGVVVLLLATVVLAWFLPARWAWPMLQPRLHGLRLEQVGGSLWDGHAERALTADGSELGRLRWTLSRRAVLGDIRLELWLEQPLLRFHGVMQRISDTELDWRDVHLRVEAALLDRQLPLRDDRLGGTLDVAVAHARLQGAWPLQLDAVACWRDAAVRSDGAWLSLGQLQLQAHGDDGVVQANLDDDGRGPLQATGRFSLSPLGWRYVATLRPRRGDPSLRRWLVRLGETMRTQPTADGAVSLQGHGGLAAALSSTEQQ
jgi:general secretion pathway protein N